MPSGRELTTYAVLALMALVLVLGLVATPSTSVVRRRKGGATPHLGSLAPRRWRGESVRRQPSSTNPGGGKIMFVGTVLMPILASASSHAGEYAKTGFELAHHANTALHAEETGLSLLETFLVCAGVGAVVLGVIYAIAVLVAKFQSST